MFGQLRFRPGELALGTVAHPILDRRSVIVAAERDRAQAVLLRVGPFVDPHDVPLFVDPSRGGDVDEIKEALIV